LAMPSGYVNIGFCAALRTMLLAAICAVNSAVCASFVSWYLGKA
jgi:hypothetical protein